MRASGACFAVLAGLFAPLGFPSRAHAAAVEHPPVLIQPKATERRLHLAGAEASSFLTNDWNRFQENYLPLYVGDDDPKTAWTEGAKGDGRGEWLRVKVTPMAGATRVRLRVRNGYQKSKRLFEANERAQGVTIVLLPSGVAVDADLADRQDWQDVVVEQPAGPLAAVELRVRSIFAGKKYDDLCISDVQVLVTATTAENPAFEKARLDQIRKWKAERLAAARLFRTALGKALPFSPQYVVVEAGRAVPPSDAPPPTANCKGDDELCFMRTEVLAAQKDLVVAKAHGPTLARTLAAIDGIARFTPVQAVARDRRAIPRVDGLCTPTIAGCDGDPCYQALPLPAPGMIGFLDAAQIATLEIKDPPTLADVEAKKPRECGLRDVLKTFAWSLRDPPGIDGTVSPIRALLLATCGAVDSREGYSSQSSSQLLVYGDDGKLEIVVGPSYAAALTWRAGESGPVLAGGRVDGLDIAEVVQVAATAP